MYARGPGRPGREQRDYRQGKAREGKTRRADRRRIARTYVADPRTLRGDTSVIFLRVVEGNRMPGVMGQTRIGENGHLRLA